MQHGSEQQRRIYEHLAVTRQALESTSDAIIIANNEGVSIYINPSFVNVFGHTVNELNVGGIPNVLFLKPTVGEHIFRTVREEGSWSGEVELTTKRGDVMAYFLSVDHIRSREDQPLGFIAIGTNVTERRRINAIQEEQRILAEAQLDVAKSLTSTLNLTEVFERILNNVDRVVPSDAANIILIDNGNARLVDRDDYSDKEQVERLRAGNTPVQHYDDLRTMLERAAPLVIPDTTEYLATHNDMQQRTPWLHSHLGIPIRLQDEVIGFLNVDSIRPGLLTQEHAVRLQLFAEQAAIAIHNGQLHERAQRLAMLEERQRLARNLHDAVSQTLFSASLIAEALPQIWQTQPDAVLPRLEQIRDLSRGALAEMRTLLLELHPERLLETPLHELIQQLAEGVLGQTRIRVILNVTKTLALSPDIHTAAYYITQEALNNVVKHAQATQVTVELREQSGELYLMIRDDGRGFDPQQIAPTSLGLNNIRERAQATAASLAIESKSGSGTQISVIWSRGGST